MSELHTFEIRQREGSKGAMTGANTEILIDGRHMAGISKVTLTIEAGGLAKLEMEAYGVFKAGGKYEPTEVVPEKQD